jgi:nitrate ABC transporter ATP-binding subunit
MSAPLEISGLTMQFETPDGPYVAVKDVSARIANAEFVCILGHSGCGKSTVLSVIAGLLGATEGGVTIDGREVDEPGTDRGVVFQSPCLLPWLSARDNVVLAVRSAFPDRSRKQQAEQARKFLAMVGVEDCYEQAPEEMSLGTQQLTSLARALSLEPRFLLLDEPFSLLDSLTRFALQDTLLSVWEQTRNTVVMVTHDIDEALYLADRLILMTDGPAARVGATLRVPFKRPRNRSAVLDDPAYYTIRKQITDFLADHVRRTHSPNNS